MDADDIETSDSLIELTEVEIIPVAEVGELRVRTIRPNPFECKKKRIPIFVVVVTTLNWIFYFYGILFIITDAHITASEPLSPPIKSWYFYTVTTWPHCEDARDDKGRIFTYQFVHGKSLFSMQHSGKYNRAPNLETTASLVHLGGNSFAALTYGALYETYSPTGFWGVLAVYFISIYMGGLGHSAIWPYKGLVGCSPGIYGLIGSCWVTWLFNRERLDHVVAFILPIILVLQLAGDVLTYQWMYSSSVGYASHFFGFYSGVMVTLTFLLWESPRDDKLRIGFGMAGVAGFVLLAVFLLDHYTESWPPQAVTYPFLHNTNYTTCCAQLFRFADTHDLSVDAAKEVSYCHNNRLHWFS